MEIANGSPWRNSRSMFPGPTPHRRRPDRPNVLSRFQRRGAGSGGHRLEPPAHSVFGGRLSALQCLPSPDLPRPTGSMSLCLCLAALIRSCSGGSGFRTCLAVMGISVRLASGRRRLLDPRLWICPKDRSFPMISSGAPEPGVRHEVCRLAAADYERHQGRETLHLRPRNPGHLHHSFHVSTASV